MKNMVNGITKDESVFIIFFAFITFSYLTILNFLFYIYLIKHFKLMNLGIESFTGINKLLIKFPVYLELIFISLSIILFFSLVKNGFDKIKKEKTLFPGFLYGFGVAFILGLIFGVYYTFIFILIHIFVGGLIFCRVHILDKKKGDDLWMKE